MRNAKKTVKFTAVLVFALFIFSGNVFSATAWTANPVPGRYVGTDGQRGYICTPPFDEICFIVYTPGEPGGGGPGPGSLDPIVAVWIGSINSGLIDINGMTVDNVSYGNVYTPLINENTQEVLTEQEVIDWLNANYGTNEP